MIELLKKDFSSVIGNYTIPAVVGTAVGTGGLVGGTGLASVAGPVGFVIGSLAGTMFGGAVACGGSSKGKPRFPKTTPDIYPLLIEYCERNNLPESQLYTKAWVQKSVFSKIRNMKNTGYKPSKTTIICLCLVLHCSIEETQEMLAIVGYTLSNSIMVDKVVAWCIEHNHYDIASIDEIICENDGEYTLIPNI